jgi:hypothetical protein
MINNREKKEIEFFLMIPTSHLPVHGISYSASILKPFLRTYHTSWLVSASKPHACCMKGCSQMRDYINSLWERVARKAFTLHSASLALSRTFPIDITNLILSFVRRYLLNSSGSENNFNKDSVN